MKNTISDIRQSLRVLRKRLGFTLTIVTTLALGIGATSAIFSVIYAVILKPLPFKNPDSLVHIFEADRQEHYQWGSDPYYSSVRPGVYQDWKAQSKSFEGIAGYYNKSLILTDGARGQELEAHEVDQNFFETLGVAPLAGHWFGPSDFATDNHVVLLSYELWKTRFAADPRLVGGTIPLDGTTYTVVGVMPAGFYPTRREVPRLWVPLIWNPDQKYSMLTWGLSTFARLKPGVSVQQAQAEMDVISEHLKFINPKYYSNVGNAVVAPVTGYTFSEYERLFYILLGAASLLLLMACTNVANLLLAHSTERGKEFAVAIALGASRWRLVRRVLIESFLLAVTGASLGVALAKAGLGPLLSLLPHATGQLLTSSSVARLSSANFNVPVLSFALGLSMLSAILFGVVPAIRATGVNLDEALKENGRGNSIGRRTRRFSDWLVIGEVAISLVLLIAAGLLIRSFMQLLHTNPGFTTDRILAISLTIPAHDYGEFKKGKPNPSRSQLYRELELRITQLPGVKSAAVTTRLPLRHRENQWAIRVEGLPHLPGEPTAAATASNMSVYWHGDISLEQVSPSYFQTFQIPLLKGRYLDARDAAGAQGVAVISESTERRYFQNQDPLGREITIDMATYFPRFAVVGVVADSRMFGLTRQTFPIVFWSLHQWPSQNCWLAVRTNVDPDQLAPAIEREIGRMNPHIAVSEVKGMDAVVGESLWQQRLSAVLLALFGTLAALLAAAGIYAVFTFMVSQRVQEIGLRIAVGASMSRILLMVLSSALRLALVGIVIGSAAALFVGRLLSAQLDLAVRNDLRIIAGVAALMVIVAVAACIGPARRVTKVDPIVALRCE